MTILASDSKRSQAPQAQDPEISVMRMLVAVATVAICAVLVVVAMSWAFIDQVAPSAIAAISTVTLAVIATFGVVLRRRPRTRSRSS
jgi:membrane protein YdbS with pleckstrin-like domain